METLISIGAACSALILLFILIFTRPSRNLPPGPPALPLIGNLHQYPRTNHREVLRAWHKKYGPLLSLRLGGQQIIVIGSIQVAKDLLGRKDRVYGTRPVPTSAGERATRGLHTALLPSTPRWKMHNRIHLSLCSPGKINAYEGIMDQQSMCVLRYLCQGKKKNAQRCFTHYSAGVVWMLAYGRALGWEDPGLHELDSMAADFSLLVGSPRWLEEISPRFAGVLYRLGWLEERESGLHRRARDLYQSCYAGALQTSSWNLAKHIQAKEDTTDMSSLEVSYMLGTLVEGSVGTTSAVLQFVIVACLLHPETMRKAQEEIDRVVGVDRMPCARDMPDLPYVRAFLNEVLRWRTIAPEGLPRETKVADNYRGYDIPQGSMVLFNQWAAHLDEEVFEHADVFEPERWLRDPDLPLKPFSVGRRSCPGQHVARAMLDMMVPRLLWGFCFEVGDLSTSTVSGLVQCGVILQPEAFDVRVRVRDGNRQAVMQREFDGMSGDVDAQLREVQRLVTNRAG